MNRDIEIAIDNLRRLSAKYSRPERYYAGDHDLSFATEKFQNAFGNLFREFAMNMCPAIVDAVKDKLRVTGFASFETGDRRRETGIWKDLPPRHRSGDTPPSQGGELEAGDLPPRHRSGATPPSQGGELSLDSVAKTIWNRNRMGQRAGEIHKEALRCGDAYAVVWFDARGEVTIYPQRAASVTVEYDEETPGRIAWAAKYWQTAEKRLRLNIFYPDRIEKYVSRNASESGVIDATEFVPFVESARFSVSSATRGGQAEACTLSNPYGVVPVFHFANNADIGAFGQSELSSAIPIQDALNKSILDMLVAMEFSAFRQRWIAGLEVETDPTDGRQLVPFQAGAERLWIAANSDTKFGDFNTSNLDQFLRVKDGFRIDMASVTGTPLHYFLQTTRSLASGEALRKNEMRFLAKVRDRQTAFGQVWADVMSFALQLAGATANKVELVTNWEDPAPLDEKDLLANILLKKQIGISTEQALIEAGYGEDGRRETGEGE